MNAARLEIARRLVACPKWVWLPGMHAVAERQDWPGMGVRVDEARDGWLFYGRAANSEASIRPAGMVPNLDEDVTRLGVLAVVRRAWGDPMLHLVRHETHVMDHCGTGTIPAVWWAIADSSSCKMMNGRSYFAGPTEIEAILAALEAAPQ